MAQEKKKVIREDGGFFNDIGNRIKLIFRLIMDPRVNIFLKLIPVASLVYLIIPAPIPPDIIPLPIDDALIIWIATYLFVELCPQDIVNEHKQALTNEIPGSFRDVPGKADENMIDGEWKEV